MIILNRFAPKNFAQDLLSAENERNPDEGTRFPIGVPVEDGDLATVLRAITALFPAPFRPQTLSEALVDCVVKFRYNACG